MGEELHRWVFAALLLSVALAAGCSASHSSKPASPGGQSLSARDAVHQTETCAPAADPGKLVLPSLVRITTTPDANGTYSSGTGIIFDQGWVLTNQHVIGSASASPVRTFYSDNHQSFGHVVAADPDLDLALVQADTGDLPAVTWGDEGQLQPGAVLYGVGFANGEKQPTKSQGRYVQTAVDRSTGQAFIVSDLLLFHGDSGGPLLNRCGQVIGINTARIQGVDRGTSAGLSIPGFGARRWSARNRVQTQ